MADFSAQIVLPAGWSNLAAAMRAAGYTGGNRMESCTIKESGAVATSVKTGHTSGIVPPAGGAEGYPIMSSQHTFWSLDIGVCWIYTMGGTIAVQAHSMMDY